MNSMPFDFDPLSLDFPALTLQCLPAPPTLSSLHPFSTDSSWSTQPPGLQQCTALQAYFAEKFRKWKIKCAAATTAWQEDIQYPPSEHPFQDPLELIERAEKQAGDQEKKVKDHIQVAYSMWTSLSEQQKQYTWLLELARSVDKKQKQIERMQDQRHSIQQENANLRSQIDLLNKLQQPREFKVQAPATLPVAQKFLEFWHEQAVVHDRRGVGLNLDDRHSDIGTVVGMAIDRWKNVVVSKRTSGSGTGEKRKLDQAALDGQVHLDRAASSSLISDSTSIENKRPKLGPGRDGTSDGFGQPTAARLHKSALSRSDVSTVSLANHEGESTAAASQFPPPELPAPSTRPPAATQVHRGTNGIPISSSASEAVKANNEEAEDVSTADTDGNRDDEMSDRDDNAEKDDGMSDQDADAEMEDDDALAYAGMIRAPVQHLTPLSAIPAQTEQTRQRHQLPATPSQPHGQGAGAHAADEGSHGSFRRQRQLRWGRPLCTARSEHHTIREAVDSRDE